MILKQLRPLPAASAREIGCVEELIEPALEMIRSRTGLNRL